MQYQSTLNREGLIDLAINKYFANVDAKNLDAVLDCFHDNAMMTTQTSFTTHAGKDNIKRRFGDYLRTRLRRLARSTASRVRWLSN